MHLVMLKGEIRVKGQALGLLSTGGTRKGSDTGKQQLSNLRRSFYYHNST